MFNSRYFTARYWLARFWRHGEIVESAPVGPICFVTYIVQPRSTTTLVQPTMTATVKQPKSVTHVECC